jgi:hypothetical protein
MVDERLIQEVNRPVTAGSICAGRNYLVDFIPALILILRKFSGGGTGQE